MPVLLLLLDSQSGIYGYRPMSIRPRTGVNSFLGLGTYDDSDGYHDKEAL